MDSASTGVRPITKSAITEVDAWLIEDSRISGGDSERAATKLGWLGKVEGAELTRLLLVEAAWVVVMFFACRIAWKRGTRRYSGFGG